MNDYERIAELIEQGRKIEAVKLLRENTGVSLEEAKAQIERLTAEAVGQVPLAERPGLGTKGLPEDVLALARAGQKLEAIKVLRERTGQGLKESKEQIEAAMGSTPVSKSSTRVVLLAALAAFLLALMGFLLPLLL
jgi:ribosomal protein L7/L12